MRLLLLTLELIKGHRGNMTVKELIDRLATEKPDALVYTMAHDDDVAPL